MEKQDASDFQELAVTLLTKREKTATGVQSALQNGSVGKLVKVCKDLTEFRAQLSNVVGATDSGVGIVDIEGASDHFLHELGRLTSTYVTIRFLVVASRFSETLALKAMQAGARHFLRESSIESELNKVLQTLSTYERETPIWPGKVVSVLSCSGGCGATTVAVNLARELQLLSAKTKKVLIIDLDDHYGSVGTYLGLQGDYGIAHVLNRDTVIDRHLIETCVVSHIEGLDVLLSPAAAEVDKLNDLRYENLGRALTVCRASHDYVIIDASRVPKGPLAGLAQVSQVVLVVFQLTIRDIGLLKSTLSFLTGLGLSRQQMVPVANRVSRRGPFLGLREVQRAIQADSIHTIRNDLRKVMKSTIRGRPLASTARRSKLRRDFRKLATTVHLLTLDE